jgi:hypothetical protein
MRTRRKRPTTRKNASVAGRRSADGQSARKKSNWMRRIST